MTPKAYAQVGYPEPPRIVQVTPEMAFAWVDNGTEAGVNTHNRPIQQHRVDRYARDMKAGRWLLTHQGIAFSKDGRLIDGQHRLWAVIESGATVPMLIHNGLDMETQTVIDTADARSIKDRLHLADRFGEVSRLEATTLRYLIGKSGGRSAARVTVAEEQDAFTMYRVGIRFVLKALSTASKKILRSPVTAAIVRAYYAGAPRAKIEAFCVALATSIAVDEPSRTALALRDALLLGATSIEAYAKTSAALAAFLDGRRLTRIYPASRELFPVEGLNAAYQHQPSRRKRADAIDTVMPYMRDKRRSTVREFVEWRGLALGMANNYKPVFDDCVKRGWLSAEAGSGRRATVYSLASTRG